MSDVYKKIEVIGTSSESFAQATRRAVERASKTLHGVNWFEVTEMRGRVDNGNIKEFQVTVKLGVKLD